MRTRRDARIASLAFAAMATVAPLTAGASESIEGTLNAMIIDYPAEDGDATTQAHDGAAAQSEEMPDMGRAEYVYRLQREDGTEVRLQGEEALAPYTTGDRLSVKGRIVSADGAAGPNRMAVRSVKPLSNQDGPVARQGTAADHGGDGIEKRRVLGVVVDFKDSETGVSLDDARNALRDASNSSDALYRMASGANADIGGQLGFFPPKGGGPDVVHVDVDITPNGCDFNDWGDKANDVAKSQGIDFSNHDHTVYFLPRGPTGDCRWAGVAYLGNSGGCSKPWCKAWVRGHGHGVTAHELGHNLGLQHSRRFTGEGSKPAEYGEGALMGRWYHFLIPPNRDYLGWYDDHPAGRGVVKAGEATVTIAGISGLSPNWGDPHPHTVKLPIGDSNHAYYAYLAEDDPSGNDWFGPVARNQVIITRTDPDRGPSGSMEFAKLGSGDSYEDEDSDIRVTVEKKSSSEATLRVENGDELVTEDVAFTMAPGQTHEGSLEASQPNGNKPSFRKESGADQGKASVNSDGGFTYTADAEAEGNDTFTFQASTEDQTAKGTAEVTFNQTPRVEPLELTVAPDGSVEETLPASDAESAIKDVALTITEPPQKGTLKGPKDDGSFTYIPDDQSSGKDTFRYTAGDAYSESEAAEVAITIEDDDDSSDPFGGGSDSSSGSDGGSGDGSDSDSGGGGAIGAPWLLLLGLLARVAGRGRRRDGGV